MHANIFTFYLVLEYIRVRSINLNLNFILTLTLFIDLGEANLCRRPIFLYLLLYHNFNLLNFNNITLK